MAMRGSTHRFSLRTPKRSRLLAGVAFAAALAMSAPGPAFAVEWPDGSADYGTTDPVEDTLITPTFTPDLLQTFTFEDQAQPTEVRVSPDGKIAYVIANLKPEIFRIDLATGTFLESLDFSDAGDFTGGDNMMLSADGRYAYVALSKGRFGRGTALGVFDLVSLKRVGLTTLPAEINVIRNISISRNPDERFIYLAGEGKLTSDDALFKYDLATLTEQDRLAIKVVNTGSFTASLDGTRVFYPIDNEVLEINTDTMQVVHESTIEDVNRVTALRYDQDPERLYYGHSTGPYTGIFNPTTHTVTSNVPLARQVRDVIGDDEKTAPTRASPLAGI